MNRLRLALVFVLLLSGAAFGQAQSSSLAGILVVDRDGLFSQSLFGQRILSDVDAATERLVAENREIENELIAEERDLTEKRPTLSPEAFRTLADAFDEKVQQIRSEQVAKSDRIGTSLDEARRTYFQAIIPILADILRENRAVAMLDKRSVLISANVIDVTATAILRIDTQFGDGRDLLGTVAAPDQ